MPPARNHAPAPVGVWREYVSPYCTASYYVVNGVPRGRLFVDEFGTIRACLLSDSADSAINAHWFTHDSVEEAKLWVEDMTEMADSNSASVDSALEVYA